MNRQDARVARVRGDFGEREHHATTSYPLTKWVGMQCVMLML